MDERKIREFVDEYDKNIEKYEAYCYGDMTVADELCKCVLDGHKRATTSLYKLYEIENEEIPKVGDLSVILDSKENPHCITKITDIKLVKFNEITPEYAFREGEGDKSLNYWKNVHKQIFSKECEEYNIKFSEDMVCVCEYFEVIYKK